MIELDMLLHNNRGAKNHLPCSNDEAACLPFIIPCGGRFNWHDGEKNSTSLLSCGLQGLFGSHPVIHGGEIR